MLQSSSYATTWRKLPAERRISDITSGDVLMQLLETCLDAVLMRGGLARTIYATR